MYEYILERVRVRLEKGEGKYERKVLSLTRASYIIESEKTDEKDGRKVASVTGVRREGMRKRNGRRNAKTIRTREFEKNCRQKEENVGNVLLEGEGGDYREARPQARE